MSATATRACCTTKKEVGQPARRRESHGPQNSGANEPSTQPTWK